MTRYVLSLSLWAALASSQPVPASPSGSCHVGAYSLSNNSHVVIQPSDADTLRYRFLDGTTGRLYPVAEHSYESGEGWAVRKPVVWQVEFGTCDQGSVRFIRKGAAVLEGSKVALPTTPIRFDSGQVHLYGELVMPIQAKPRAIVVLQYGSGRDSAVANNYVQYLLPLKDIGVFVFDKRGTGRSTGEYSIDITVLANDMVAAVEAVRSRSEVRGAALGLMGESQGGWVAPLAAHSAPVDFVVVSYGLAVSMLEEDRQEVARSLSSQGYGADVLAMGEQVHEAAARVMLSRFAEGLDELEKLKAAYADEPWFSELGGDFTALLATTPAERMGEVQEMFDFPYDLAYDPLPLLEALEVPQLWVLAGKDTEAPHEATLDILQQLQAGGAPVEIAVFPDAEHGMIAVEGGAGGSELAGRTAEGYFELLFDWIGRQEKCGGVAPPQSQAERCDSSSGGGCNGRRPRGNDS